MMNTIVVAKRRLLLLVERRALLLDVDYGLLPESEKLATLCHLLIMEDGGSW